MSETVSASMREEDRSHDKESVTDTSKMDADPSLSEFNHKSALIKIRSGMEELLSSKPST